MTKKGISKPLQVFRKYEIKFTLITFILKYNYSNFFKKN